MDNNSFRDKSPEEILAILEEGENSHAFLQNLTYGEIYTFLTLPPPLGAHALLHAQECESCQSRVNIALRAETEVGPTRKPITRHLI